MTRNVDPTPNAPTHPTTGSTTAPPPNPNTANAPAPHPDGKVNPAPTMDKASNAEPHRVPVANPPVPQDTRTKCPQCGSHDVGLQAGVYHCSKCKASFKK